MVWWSKMEVFKKIVLTLNPWNLEFVGVFEFLVLDKKILKPHADGALHFCLFLSTETGTYSSPIAVAKKKYRQAKLGKVYGPCGVIRNINHDDFMLITENTNPDTAIKQAVLKSWGKMLFIILVLGLWLVTVLFFLWALLHLSWN